MHSSGKRNKIKGHLYEFSTKGKLYKSKFEISRLIKKITLLLLIVIFSGYCRYKFNDLH